MAILMFIILIYNAFDQSLSGHWFVMEEFKVANWIIIHILWMCITLKVFKIWSIIFVNLCIHYTEQIQNILTCYEETIFLSFPTCQMHKLNEIGRSTVEITVRTRFALISVILICELRGLRLDRGLDRIVVVG